VPLRECLGVTPSTFFARVEASTASSFPHWIVLPIICLLALFLTLPCSRYTRAAEPAAEMLGNWSNVDTQSRGLTRLEIVQAGDKLQQRGWGKCHPHDCEWGATKLELLGDSIEAKQLSYGFATWDHGFSVVHLTLHWQGKELIAQTHTIFRDQSKRANYLTEYRLRPARP
jgi:hypothetical protein